MKPSLGGNSLVCVVVIARFLLARLPDAAKVARHARRAAFDRSLDRALYRSPCSGAASLAQREIGDAQACPTCHQPHMSRRMQSRRFLNDLRMIGASYRKPWLVKAICLPT